MQNSLVGIAVAAVVGAVVALVAASSGVALFSGMGVGKKMVNATINLNQVGGSCLITTAPQKIEAFKKETIEWTIVNGCDDTQGADITLVFANDPLAEGCEKKGKKKISCTVRQSAGFASYKYSVEAPGAVKEDPELEIVQ